MYAPGKGLCGVWGIANMLYAFFEDECFREKDRNLFTKVLRHVSLLFRIMNHQNKIER